MNLIINKQLRGLTGTCTPPGSKSQTIRALCIATLAYGTSVIQNALDSDDTQSCIALCRNLGAKISISESSAGLALTVESKGIPFIPTGREFYTSNSGITTRFCMPILGFADQKFAPFELLCGEQMQARPIRPMVAALQNLGMDIRSNTSNNIWPLVVSGSLEGGNASVDGTTSQFLSALLISLPCAEKKSRITVHALNERPYALMTAHWLTEQGITFSWETTDDNDEIISIAGGQKYRPFNKRIPADFSSASYLVAAAVLCGEIVHITHIDMNDAQGDKKLIPILQSMGADIAAKNDMLTIKGGKELQGIEIDCNDIPDLVPTLAVIGTQARGTTRLYNVGHARLKETDRIHSMYSELSKLGANIQQLTDGLSISQSNLRGNVVEGHDDHRTIMSLAIAGLLAQGETTIQGSEGISKTFPGFTKTLQSLGALIHQNN